MRREEDEREEGRKEALLTQSVHLIYKMNVLN